jgi:hypothetical protein
MVIPDHDFYLSGIPVSATNYKREGKIFFLLSVSHKFDKIENHPRFLIPDPTTATKEGGGRDLLSNLFCWFKFYQIKFSFLTNKENNLIHSFRITVPYFFSQKIVIKLTKNKGLGSRIQGSKRHGIRDPDSQHCTYSRVYPS